MTKEKQDNLKSNCCQAPVVVVGSDDFYEGDSKDYPCTCHYECLQCSQPCDTMVEKQDKAMGKAKRHIACDDIIYESDINPTPTDTQTEGETTEKQDKTDDELYDTAAELPERTLFSPRAEIQRICFMLEGNVPKKKVCNYIKEYLDIDAYWEKWTK